MSDKKHNHWLILILLALAQFMVVLDTSIVNVALPVLQKSLHFSPSALQWVITAYTLTFGGFLLLGGRAADLFGRRRMFLIGVTVFSFVSLMDGLATSSGMFVGLRAIQGLAAALMSPAALSIVLITYNEGGERNKALSIWGAVAAGGAAAGVLLGGILTEYLGWRSNFFINVPVGILVATTALRILPKHESEAKDNNLDLPGAASVTSAMMLLVYALTEAPSHGWLATSTLGYFAASLALFVFFFINEQRAKHPLIPLSIFKIRNVAGANLIQVMNAASLYSVFFFTSLYLQSLLGYSPVKTGLSFLAIPVVLAVAATNAPRVIKHVGYKRVLVVAPLLVMSCMLLLTRVTLGGGYFVHLMPAFILMGIGTGFSFVSTTIAATSGVSRDKSGLASGLVNTSQQLGGSLGLAVLAGIASAEATRLAGRVKNGTAHLSSAQITLHSYHVAFLTAASFTLVASLLAIFVLKHTKGEGGTAPKVIAME